MAKVETVMPRTPEKVILELDYDEARTLSALLYSAVGASTRTNPGGIHWERLSGIGRAMRYSMREAWTFDHDSLMDDFVFKTHLITDCVRDRVWQRS